MKINVKKTIIIFLILFAVIIAIDVIFLQNNYYEGTFFKMDTNITIRGEGENMDLAARDILTAIDEIEAEMSANNIESKLYKLNNISKENELFSDDFIYLLNLSEEIKKNSGGAFNIALKPVIDLWGFGGNYPKVPKDNEIKATLQEVQNTIIEVDANNVSTNGKLDLGGIAKGFAGDKAREILNIYSPSYAILDFGGNIITYGSKPDGTEFKIGIDNGEGNIFATVSVKECNVITSGGYQRYFEKNGVKYHHIIDSTTGYPAENELISVTVLSDSGALADALSTACYVLGLEKGMELINKYEVESVFLTKDKKVYTTPGINIEISDPEYTLQ